MQRCLGLGDPNEQNCGVGEFNGWLALLYHYTLHSRQTLLPAILS